MNYYIEITLLASTDIKIFALWSKVFQQLHLGLVEIQDGQGHVPIGISFPEYVVGEKISILGGKCRLIADQIDTLSRFDVLKRLGRLSDSVHCTDVLAVPENISGYATYQRLQQKTNGLRLARRFAKRHSISVEEAYPKFSLNARKTNSAPYIWLRSLSSNHNFCLWIKKNHVSKACAEKFSTYGLSPVATVPEF